MTEVQLKSLSLSITWILCHVIDYAKADTLEGQDEARNQIVDSISNLVKTAESIKD